MTTTIRLATPDDARRIQAIYAPHVLDSVVSFEREPPSVEDVRRRITATLERHPWLVGVRDGEVAGYASAHRHRDRAAYQWSVESSVYVDEDHRRTGVARGLYTSLFEVLRLQGFFSVYAGIALPNPASVAFHDSMGFQPIGTFENVGYKHGAWHDVGWWYRSLGEHPQDPEAPTALRAARSHERWDEAVSAGLSSMRR